MRLYFSFCRSILKATVFLTTPFFVWLVLGSATAQALFIGEQQTFKISSQYDFSGRSSLTATLRLLGQKAQYLIEDEYWNGRLFSDQQDLLQKLSALAEEFDSRIYPQSVALWGSEPNPGVDRDPRLFVVLSNLADNAGGYFDTANQYTRDRVPDSNEKEVIFLNVRVLEDRRKISAFLAHEFQHLITFNQKEQRQLSLDDTWLNELRSEYSATMLGYNDPYTGSNLRRRVAAFTADPTDSLTEWENEAADYGQTALFGEYLAEQFGARVIADTLGRSSGSTRTVSEALQANGYPFSFDQVFLRWAVANTINDQTLDRAYGYSRGGFKDQLKVAPTQIISNLNDSSQISVQHNFKDWQAKWFWISSFPTGQKNTLKVNFGGSDKSFFQTAIIVFRANEEREILFYNLNDGQKTTDLFFDLQAGVEKLIIIPVKTEKISGFTSQEPLSSLSLSLQRVTESEGSQNPIISPVPTLSPQPSTGYFQPAARPIDFGLKEGDFIRAWGDNDVFIINDFGYKRLVLNPQICLQYRHLGERGCFTAVKIVSPVTRDAFQTSWFYTNGETQDGKVYWLEQTGDDTAILRHLNISGAEFVSQGGSFRSVFLFNSLEQKTYLVGQAIQARPI